MFRCPETHKKHLQYQNWCIEQIGCKKWVIQRNMSHVCFWLSFSLLSWFAMASMRIAELASIVRLWPRQGFNFPRISCRTAAANTTTHDGASPAVTSKTLSGPLPTKNSPPGLFKVWKITYSCYLYTFACRHNSFCSLNDSPSNHEIYMWTQITAIWLVLWHNEP